MGRITFILGGARSGKSAYAVKLAASQKSAKKIAFIATCIPRDKEMKQRIAAHKSARPAEWKTFEAEEDLLKALESVDSRFEAVIIDCLTLWVSNLVLKGLSRPEIENRIKKVMAFSRKMKCRLIIVSNEVGLGIVPANRLARDFRDIAGRVNQIVAAEAGKVLFMVSGLPLTVKTSIKSKAINKKGGRK